jgi:hypothetical protein
MKVKFRSAGEIEFFDRKSLIFSQGNSTISRIPWFNQLHGANHPFSNHHAHEIERSLLIPVPADGP